MNNIFVWSADKRISGFVFFAFQYQKKIINELYSIFSLFCSTKKRASQLLHDIFLQPVQLVFSSHCCRYFRRCCHPVTFRGCSSHLFCSSFVYNYSHSSRFCFSIFPTSKTCASASMSSTLSVIVVVYMIAVPPLTLQSYKAAINKS